MNFGAAVWLENCMVAPLFLCPFYGIGRVRIIRMGDGIEIGEDGGNMFFGKKDKDVRLTDNQYKDLVSNMNKAERREFERKQNQLRRDREDDRLMGWLFFEDELDDM